MIHRTMIAAGILVAGAVLAGCSDDNNPDPLPTTPTDTTISISVPAESSEVPDTDRITPEAAQQLCDMIRPEIDNWRDQGHVLGRVSFNGTVHNWAARNGGLNDTVVRDRGIVDTITTQHCPDVRQQAIDALGISDLASGLAGFGG